MAEEHLVTRTDGKFGFRVTSGVNHEVVATDGGQGCNSKADARSTLLGRRVRRRHHRQHLHPRPPAGDKLPCCVLSHASGRFQRGQSRCS